MLKQIIQLVALSFISQIHSESSINYKDNICILSTAALINHRSQERKQEYISGIENHKKAGYPILIAESCELSDSSFLDEYCEHVCYTKSNDYNKKNKGVNEAVAMLKALEYFKVPDDVMVVKVTGRYLFQNFDFLKSIVNNPNYDAYAKITEPENVVTACFAMRCKYLKKLLKELDLDDMETRWQCIEWEVARFINKHLPSDRVFKVNSLGVTGVMFGEGNGWGLSYW